MASINTAHHQDGGVLLYNGELVLLFCDKVNCDIDNVGNTNGRLYLTTHRIVYTSQPINQNPRLMSIAAPFYAMFDLGLEQPVFGANYIKGKVRTNSSQNTSALTQNEFTFKLKFNKGGACEFGRALSAAAKQASANAQQTGWSNNYSFSSSPASQYYAAPSDIYQPQYPVGFVLPSQVFNDVPQTGTIYYQQSPPPYPGLVTAHQAQQQTQYAPMYPVPNASHSAPFQVNQQSNNSPHHGVYPQAPPPPQQQPPQGYNPNNNNSAYDAQNPYVHNYNPNYSNQPPQRPFQPQQSYQPGFATYNNGYQQQQYQPQYPQAPQQAGYMPQSNNTYPNIPSYNEANAKKGF